MDETEILKKRIIELETELENLVEKGAGELKVSEEKFRVLFEKSYDPFLIIDEYEFIECNQATANILGYKSASEILTTHPSKLSPEYQPDGKPSFLKAQEMMDIAYENGYHRFEWVHLNNVGKELWMDVALTRIPYKGKEMLFTIWRDISKRKEFEKELIESEKRYSTLFEQAADGILVGINDGEIINANESILHLTKYKKHEIIGSNIKNLFEKEQLIIKPLRYDLIEKGATLIRERNIITKDGKLVPIEMSTKLLEDGRMQALIRDISIRKQAELDLRASEEKYKSIFHNSPLGIIHYDNHGVITDCNEYFVKIVGSSKDILIGLNMLKDLKNRKLENVVKNSLTQSESYYEDWYTSVTGNRKTFVRAFFKAIIAGNGNAISGIGLIEDISERKKAENDLVLSEEKFKSLATLLPEVVYEVDVSGNILFVNFKAYEIFGYTQEDMKNGVSIFQMLAPEEVERVKENMSNIVRGHMARGERYTAITKQGKRFPILIYSDIIKDNKKIVGLRGIIVNIEELTKAEENVRKSEEKFRLLFENSQDAIFITDNKGYVDCNSQAVHMFGCKNKAELLSKTSADFSPEYQPNGVKSAETSLEHLEQAKNGETKSFEWLHKRLDGSRFYAEVSLIPFNIDEKRYLQSIVRDITERKEIEQRIYDAVVQTEESERQRLASDIHDEIGPLLSSLKVYIESLNNTNDKQKQAFLKSKLKSLVVESINNVREVSNALSPYLLNKYGLNIAISAFMKNTEEIIDIEFETNLEKERFVIKHETAYYRVVKELINNTIKHAKANKIRINLNFINDELVLAYEDNGIGFNINKYVKDDYEGMGLRNITNRIKSINGRYKFYKPKSKGFGFEVISEVILKTE
jgi:PAS domain S-box-containing protein